MSSARRKAGVPAKVPQTAPQTAPETAPETASETAPEVVHEPASRRRHVRLSMPIQAIIDGKVHSVIDWSLSGLQIDGVEGLPGVGGRFTADLAVPFSDFNFALTVTCEIVWMDIDRHRVGCRFIDLRENQLNLLRYLVDAFVSGRIATVDGLLTTAHGEPGPSNKGQATGEGEPEPTAFQKASRAAKKGSIAGLFVALGVAIALLAGVSIYNRLFSVSSELAWIHGVIIPVRATAEGSLAGAPLEANSGVEQGARLLRIENSSLRGEVELAAATLKREEERLAGLRVQLTELEKFFEDYNDLAAVESDRARARVSEAEVALEITRRKLERAQVLFDKGHVSAAHLEERQADFAAAEKDLQLARADLAESKSNAEVAGRGYYFTGTRVEGGEPAEIQRQVRLAEESVRIARTNVEALRAQQDSLDIRSPCDCVVHESLVVPGMWVERGDLLYRLVEARDKQTIKALVPQDRVSRLAIGSLAEIRLADRDGILTGEVSSIDRISGNAGAPGGMGGMGLVPNRHRFAEVTVTLDERAAYIPAGLPAIVSFPIDIADWARDLFGIEA